MCLPRKPVLFKEELCEKVQHIAGEKSWRKVAVLPTLNFYCRPFLSENRPNFKKLGQIAKIGGFWVAVAPLELFFEIQA